MKSIQLKSLIIAQLLLVSNCAFSQTIVWQKSYGSSSTAFLESVSTYNDKILINTNADQNGNDKSEPSFGSTDAWVFTIDEDGSILWEKSFGTWGEDKASGVHLAKDGSAYVTVAAVMGNTGNLQLPTYSIERNIWLLKLNQQGDIVWQMILAGSIDDDYALLLEDEQENIIVAINSMSDSSGSRTPALKGMSDVWLVKLNKNGDVLWQHSVGGSGEETISSINFNSKGNLILGIKSNSPISIDKAEPLYGEDDIWLVEMDTNTRNIVKQKSLGGDKVEDNSILRVLNNGNYIVAISSSSTASGNKTKGSNSTVGEAFNHWILMLDEDLDIIWQEVYGGTASDYVTSLTFNGLGEIFITGYSSSNSSGNKLTDNKGSIDLWTYKLNQNGEKLTEFGIGGQNLEFYTHTFFDKEGLMTFVAYSNSDIGLDRTVPLKGYVDVWVFKLDIETSVATFSIDEDVKLYPNPSKSFLTVEIPKSMGIRSMEIYTLQGKLVHSQNVNNTQMQIDVSAYAKGTYLVKLTNQQGISISSKVIVN